jgi:hypothetical protein
MTSRTAPAALSPGRPNRASTWWHYAFLVGLVIVLWAATHSFLKRDSAPDEQRAAVAVPEALPVQSTAPGSPGVVHEDKGRLELVRRVTLPEIQPVKEVAPELPVASVHIKVGESANLHFELRKSGRSLSASVSHRNDPAEELPVIDKGDGTYDVPITPEGPGRFDVVISEGGVPVATRRVGVVGVAGAPAQEGDPDFLSVDPRSPRMRTSGRGRLR